MKYNCFFEDRDLFLSVKPLSFIEPYPDGCYSIKLKVNHSDVTNLTKNDVHPTYDVQNNVFYISVRLTNNSRVFIDHVKINYFGDKNIAYISKDMIKIKEFGMRVYKSNDWRRDRIFDCYATRVLFELKR